MIYHGCHACDAPSSLVEWIEWMCAGWRDNRPNASVRTRTSVVVKIEHKRVSVNNRSKTYEKVYDSLVANRMSVHMPFREFPGDEQVEGERECTPRVTDRMPGNGNILHV